MSDDKQEPTTLTPAARAITQNAGATINGGLKVMAGAFAQIAESAHRAAEVLGGAASLARPSSDDGETIRG